jgi:predicted site-specific integrase-resolvase
MTPAEAGKVLGVSTTRVKQFADTGRLLAVRTSLGRLIDAQSVEQLARQRAAARQGTATTA